MTVIMVDIGGTHGRFACEEAGELKNCFKVAASSHQTFVEGLESYTRQFGYDNKGDLYLAVAAHDDGTGTWRFSNSNKWVIRPAELARMGWNVRTIVMDFYASTRGALVLGPDQLELVKQGQDSRRNRAVLGPGTGLGLAYAITLPDGKTHVQETYGGRMLMAAVTDEQAEILRLVQRFKGPGAVVECEDVVSGRGLPLLYRAVCERQGRPAVYSNAEDILDASDEPNVQDCLRLFHEFLGIFTHHVVLTGHAFGGVYMDGGMIHRLRAANLFKPDQIVRFMDLPGPSVVERDLGQTPVWVVNDPYVALRGLQELKRDV